MYDEKLGQFDRVIESQVDNEIAKEIDKAHTYKLFLPNYIGYLDKNRILEWNIVLKAFTHDKNKYSTIESKYNILKKLRLK